MTFTVIPNGGRKTPIEETSNSIYFDKGIWSEETERKKERESGVSSIR